MNQNDNQPKYPKPDIETDCRVIRLGLTLKKRYSIITSWKPDTYAKITF